MVVFLVALPLVAGCVGPYPGAFGGGYGGGYGGYGGTPYGGGGGGVIPVPVPVPGGSDGAAYGYGGYGYGATGQPIYGYAPNGQVQYDYNHNGYVDRSDMRRWHRQLHRRQNQTAATPTTQPGNQTPNSGTDPTNNPTTGNTGTQPTNGSGATVAGKPHPNNGGFRWPITNPTPQPGKPSGPDSGLANSPQRPHQLNVPPQARQQLQRAQTMPQVANRAGMGYRAPMAQPNMGAARPNVAMPRVAPQARVAPRVAAPAVSRQAQVRRPGL